MGSYLRGRSAWLVAASIGAVEALKDQGFCRFDYAMKVVQQRTRNNLMFGSCNKTHQAKKMSSLSSSSSSAMATNGQELRLKESEESLRKVMYLSCWAPN
ncbi:hypothetical protein ABFS82_08G181800 [Erythranthe guttata]|uniref:Wound-responsive family protein n=1 Tax=Erythranthe guttata TaxID=4155 RepID=A0A022QY71_ERYGU|nr:hypothetical protein MIMGU_mgv1a017673mg [Erythranthe guttata]